MFRRSDDLNPHSAHQEDRGRRWRSVFIALLLALVVGGAGQHAPAQAAPAGDASIRVYMDARRLEQQTLCVGTNTEIQVHVYKEVEVVGERPMLGHLIGVEVQASVVDSSIGRINRPSNLTLTAFEGGTFFSFSAEKPGTTIIQFRGKVSSRVFLGLEISSDIVTTELSVTVEECQ